MIRLQLKHQNHSVEDDFLALPGAQPLTLHQVSAENLPYACQCPLCGGLFELPTGILYKLEDDNIEDGESDLEAIGPEGPGPGEDMGGGFFNEGPDMGGIPEEAPTEPTIPEG